MCGALQCVASTQTHDMLGQHRLFARGGPHDRRREFGKVAEQVDDLICGQGRNCRVGERYDGMIRDPEEMRSHSHEIAGNDEIQHLPTSVGQLPSFGSK